jgi:hypothetical protein
VVAISLSLYILHLLKNAQNTAPPEKALMDKAGNETPIPRDELGPEKREKDQGAQEKRK